MLLFLLLYNHKLLGYMVVWYLQLVTRGIFREFRIIFYDLQLVMSWKLPVCLMITHQLSMCLASSPRLNENELLIYWSRTRSNAKIDSTELLSRIRFEIPRRRLGLFLRSSCRDQFRSADEPLGILNVGGGPSFASLILSLFYLIYACIWVWRAIIHGHNIHIISENRK